MTENLLGTNVVTQIGLLVHDIEKTSDTFATLFGMPKPKWNWTDTIDKTEATYNGNPCPARAKLAFFSMGNLDIELIEPDHEPSTWRDYLNEHGEGVHHIAFQIKGMGEVVKRFADAGAALIQKGEYTGGRYAYIDTSESLKVILELLENDSSS